MQTKHYSSTHIIAAIIFNMTALMSVWVNKEHAGMFDILLTTFYTAEAILAYIKNTISQRAINIVILCNFVMAISLLILAII